LKFPPLRFAARRFGSCCEPPYPRVPLGRPFFCEPLPYAAPNRSQHAFSQERPRINGFSAFMWVLTPRFEKTSRSAISCLPEWILLTTLFPYNAVFCLTFFLYLLHVSPSFNWSLHDAKLRPPPLPFDSTPAMLCRFLLLYNRFLSCVAFSLFSNPHEAVWSTLYFTFKPFLANPITPLSCRWSAFFAHGPQDTLFVPPASTPKPQSSSFPITDEARYLHSVSGEVNYCVFPFSWILLDFPPAR